MAKKEEKSSAVAEFELIIESIRKERGEEYYERNKEEYDRILAKLEANPGMHFNDIGFTSFENNKVIG